MKTVFIFDQCDAGLRFFTLDGDFSHLDKVYINSCEPEDWTRKQVKDLEKKQTELSELLYWPDGNLKFVTLLDFPAADVLEGGKVITVGFLP